MTTESKPEDGTNINPDHMRPILPDMVYIPPA
jgi:hypothetical protein